VGVWTFEQQQGPWIVAVCSLVEAWCDVVCRLLKGVLNADCACAEI
jgi:hypothetical protein